MIARIWHGWTSRENADSYEQLLYDEIFVGIHQMNINGYRGIELLRRDHPEEVEFITIMKFDQLEDIVNFTGEDYEGAYVPHKARALLSRFDERSQHYEIRQRSVF